MSILLSGPAGSGKSARARELLSQATKPTIVADFTSLFNAVRLIERQPDGTFPVRTDRDNVYLPIAETMRREAIRQARQRGLEIVATNSDGDARRRTALVASLGEGAVEEVIDPGEQVVRARLADAISGELSSSCEGAINRWYRRLR